MWKSTWRVDWGMFSVDIIILIECIDVSKYCFFCIQTHSHEVKWNIVQLYLDHQCSTLNMIDK